VSVSTARAGNVIGGGDFAKDRIIPDCVRAAEHGEAITLRNPHSTRPYQHVLEALAAYLLIIQKQYENPGIAGSYNVGPDDEGCVTTGNLATLFCEAWGEAARWEFIGDPNAPHEAGFLKLDCAKIKAELGWKPSMGIKAAVQNVVEWEKARISGADIKAITDRQINDFFTES
jgi:CDP-glucose 4,6-dehydratase